MSRSLGDILKRHREASGLSQRALAKQLGVRPSYIALLETDQRRPSFGILLKIASRLSIDSRKLLLLAYPEIGELIEEKHPQEAVPDAWERFVGSPGLLARHKVSRREVKVLEQVNLLGKVSSPRQYIYILHAIRQALADSDEL